mgnify:CR=1 FL=1
MWNFISLFNLYFWSGNLLYMYWGRPTLNQGNHQVERSGINDFFGLIPSNGLVDHPLKLWQIKQREIFEKNRFFEKSTFFENAFFTKKYFFVKKNIFCKKMHLKKSRFFENLRDGQVWHHLTTTIVV